jgi:hypothetical protein
LGGKNVPEKEKRTWMNIKCIKRTQMKKRRMGIGNSPVQD